MQYLYALIYEPTIRKLKYAGGSAQPVSVIPVVHIKF